MPPHLPGPNMGPTISPPAEPHDPYEFIVNYHPKSNNPFSSNSSSTSRLLLVLGGGVLLIVVAWIFLSIMSKSSATNTADILAVAKRQTEIARVSQNPAQQAHQQPTKDFATTLQLTMQTEQKELVGFLRNHGIQADPKTLAMDMNHQTDAALLTAQSNGVYDETYLSIAQTQIAQYQTDLKQAFAGAKSKTERTLLTQDYQASELLVKLSSQTE